MKRRVDISAEEMLRLREEEGLSNAEIAQRLDLHYATVHKYIGKQPEGIRAPMGSRKKPEIVPRPETFITLKAHYEQYDGKYGKYSIDRCAKNVRVSLESPECALDKQGLEEMISELLDVLKFL